MNKALSNVQEKLKSTIKTPYALAIICISVVIGIMTSVYLQGEATIDDKLGGPTQFGQFGDYIGGVLNPILGFITILLLLHAASLNKKQLDIGKDEYNRKQLEDALRVAHKNYEEILERKVDGLSMSLKRQLENDKAYQQQECMVVYRDHTTKFKNIYRVYQHFNTLKREIELIVELTPDIINLTHVNSLQRYWAHEAATIIKDWGFIFKGNEKYQKNAKIVLDLYKNLNQHEDPTEA